MMSKDHGDGPSGMRHSSKEFEYAEGVKMEEALPSMFYQAYVTIITPSGVQACQRGEWRVESSR